MRPPPYSALEPVREIFHGVSVADLYRWLEDQVYEAVDVKRENHPGEIAVHD